MIHFRVNAIPVAQPRQRHRVVHGKDGRTFASNYTPKGDPVNAFKASVRLAAADAYDGPPLDGPLHLSLMFVMPRTKAKRWKTKPMPRLWHIKKPDIDNLIKSFVDSLSGLLWPDDNAICRITAGKLMARGDEQPHVEAWVREQLAAGVPLSAIEEE